MSHPFVPERLLRLEGSLAGKLLIAADLQGEWHINRALFTVTPVEPGGWTFGEAVVPPGEKTGSEADGTAREDLTTDFEVSLPYSGSGAEELAVDVWYQACKGATLCLMPTTEQIKVKMVPAGAAPTVVETAPAQPATPITPATEPPPAAVATTDSAFSQAASQGIGALLLLCFLAGVGVSFTPCVLPIVPITMGIIGARSAGSRLQAISLAGTYVLGQAVVYTSLAVVVAQTGGLFGSWLQSPVLTFGIAGFFVIMGFSMFGFFDVQMPESIVNRLQGTDARSGYVGAAMLGVIGALVAGPCSGPIVASLLVFIGVQGNVVTGMALMFTFSLGMGMIFLVTGALTGWMPARGPWMATVKKGMGIFLWLMAVNFAAPHLSTTVVALATAAVLLSTGVFSWPNPEDGEGIFTVRLRQLYAILGVTVGLWLLVAPMATQGFILPAIQLSSASAGTTQSAPGIPWLNDHDQALAQAKASNKPLLIDFTADWCKACKELEHFTYTDPQVIAASKDFVPVMIDCTEAADPGVKAIQARYGVNGLPTVLMVTPDGTISEKLIGFEAAGEFLGRMRRVVPAGAGG
jgi:thiol:disulfide interchange protein DsbD